MLLSNINPIETGNKLTRVHLCLRILVNLHTSISFSNMNECEYVNLALVHIPKQNTRVLC